MNYALYQYINKLGFVRHALVNIKTKKIRVAELFSYNLVWKDAPKDNDIWDTIQLDKHHRILATATRPEHIVPRN